MRGLVVGCFVGLMMFWYGNGMNGWSYVLMAAGMVVFWALVVIGVVALVRYFGRESRAVVIPAAAEQVLAERFARGEIDEQEYGHRLDVLRGAVAPAAMSTVTPASGGAVPGRA